MENRVGNWKRQARASPVLTLKRETLPDTVLVGKNIDPSGCW